MSVPNLQVDQEGSVHTSTAVYQYAQIWPVASEAVTNLTDKTGYTFTGWDKQFASITEDTTVNPTYTANTYTIGYSMNGGTKGTNGPTSGTYDSNVTVSKPTKTFTVNIDGNSQSATIKLGDTAVTSVSSTQTFDGWTAP